MRDLPIYIDIVSSISLFFFPSVRHKGERGGGGEGGTRVRPQHPLSSLYFHNVFIFFFPLKFFFFFLSFTLFIYLFFILILYTETSPLSLYLLLVVCVSFLFSSSRSSRFYILFFEFANVYRYYMHWCVFFFFFVLLLILFTPPFTPAHFVSPTFTM